MKRYLLLLYWKYIFFPEISRDKWGINDRAFDDSSTSLFVPSHEILFSRVCGPLLRERETGFTAKSAPGTGCWLCNMNVEDCRGARKAVQQGEKRTETSAVSGQVSGGGCRPCTILRFRMFLLAFAKLFFFLFHPLLSPSIHVQLDAKVTISRFQNTALFTTQPIFALITNIAERTSWVTNYYKFLQGNDAIIN